jgi:hypothetical protein
VGVKLPWKPGVGSCLVAFFDSRDALLFYREAEDEDLTLLIADGPGQVRTVAEHAGLIALSPDGSLALLTHFDNPGAREVSLYNVADIAELDRIDVSSNDPPLGVVGPSGDWVNDLVVADAADPEGVPGLVIFKVSDTKITLQQTLMFHPRDVPASLEEPRFTNNGERVAVRSAQFDSGRNFTGYVYLDCDLAANNCKKSKLFKKGTKVGTGAVGTIHNPSRA